MSTVAHLGGPRAPYAACSPSSRPCCSRPLLGVQATADAEPAGHGDRGHDTVRFSTFNASLNRNAAGELVARPVHAGQRAGEERRRDDPAGATPTCCWSTSSTTHPRPSTCSATTTSRSRRTAPTPIDLPLRLHRAVEHRRPQRLRPQQQRRASAVGDDALRVRRVRGPVRHGRLLEVPHRHRPASAPSSTSSGRTCPGAMLPDDPATPAPADWYSAEELDGAAGCRRSRTGTCRSGSAGRPCTSWSRTRHRRSSTVPRTATARATSTRSGSGPTTSRRRKSRYIYDDAGRRGGLPAGRGVRDRRRPELRPARRRLGPGRGPAAARQPAGQRPRHRRPRRAAPEAAALQGGANATHRSDPAYDTADFSDTRPGNLRADYVLPSKSLSDHWRWHLLADERATRCSG